MLPSNARLLGTGLGLDGVYTTSVKSFLTNFLIASVCPARAAACNEVALSLSSRFMGIPPSFSRSWIIQIKVGLNASGLHILEVLLVYCGTMCWAASLFYYSY